MVAGGGKKDGHLGATSSRQGHYVGNMGAWQLFFILLARTIELAVFLTAKDAKWAKLIWLGLILQFLITNLANLTNGFGAWVDTLVFDHGIH